jgi:hypothetical protein
MREQSQAGVGVPMCQPEWLCKARAKETHNQTSIMFEHAIQKTLLVKRKPSSSCIVHRSAIFVRLSLCPVTLPLGDRNSEWGNLSDFTPKVLKPGISATRSQVGFMMSQSCERRH